MMNNVYRVWFDAGVGNEVCCVLVAAKDGEKALELAREQVKDFPILQNAQYQISIFDIESERASIC